MDLTIKIDKTLLNIRVVVLAKTKNGYILEKSPDGYLYFIGGRIKISENSEQAAKRELLEEVGISDGRLRFTAVIENFFKLKEQPVHEISFVYSMDEEIEIQKLAKDRIEVPIRDLINMDIRPLGLRDYILSGDQRSHVILK